MLNREFEIISAYTDLGYEPRDNQLSIIDNILTQFLDKFKRNVILSAGTGVGKSIIAAVVARVMGQEINSKLSAVYLSSTNILVDQYADSFSKLPESDFFRIKGATNYACPYFNLKGNFLATGEDCVYKELHEMEQKKFCTGCTYKQSRKLINTTQNLITNYAYFFMARLGDGYLEPRMLTVFDESHLLNESYVSNLTISLSIDNISKYVSELSKLNNKLEKQIAELILIKQKIIQKKVTISNYREEFKLIKKVYVDIATICNNQAMLIPDMVGKLSFKKANSKYARLAGLIQKFIDTNFEHVFDNTEKDTISIKPIFIKDMVNELLGQYNLFMSATLSPNFINTTMELDPKVTAYIDAPEVFPVENKKIFFIGKENLNYEKMQKSETFDELGKIINLILEHHKNQKGIILVPSFVVTRTLTDKIKIKGIKVFEHARGNAARDIVEEFKNYSEPSLLISPSIFEGISFDGLLSEYQIFVKTPYASLGDVRIKKIADSYGSIYREMTLYKILQGIGRSVRSKEDVAVSYFLDKSTETLFKSNLNLWKDRYSYK